MFATYRNNMTYSTIKVNNVNGFWGSIQDYEYSVCVEWHRTSCVSLGDCMDEEIEVIKFKCTKCIECKSSHVAGSTKRKQYFEFMAYFRSV